MPDAAKPVVAIVDPISTGASLAKFLSDRGYPLVRVFSDTLPDEESTHGGHAVAHPSARLSEVWQYPAAEGERVIHRCSEAS